MVKSRSKMLEIRKEIDWILKHVPARFRQSFLASKVKGWNEEERQMAKTVIQRKRSLDSLNKQILTGVIDNPEPFLEESKHESPEQESTIIKLLKKTYLEEPEQKSATSEFIKKMKPMELVRLPSIIASDEDVEEAEEEGIMIYRPDLGETTVFEGVRIPNRYREALKKIAKWLSKHREPKREWTVSDVIRLAILYYIKMHEKHGALKTSN